MASALLDALAKLTQADLDAVNKELGELQAQVTQLTELKRVIEVKLGVSKPRGWHLKEARAKAKAARSSKPEAESEPTGDLEADDSLGESSSAAPAGGYTNTERHRLRAREFLMANGPTKQAALAHRCNIPQGSITAVLKHEWFTTTSRGVELTRSLKKEPT